MNKKFLIVGIDPGATLGYAALDINSNLILLGSEKHCTLNELITKIIILGDVIIVGTDKKHPPYFVSQFATKLGAKIIHPKKDLLVNEKRIATSLFNTKNYHELDALASALFASNEIRPLINKINSFIKIYDKEHIKDSLIKKVILDGINIKGAAELIERTNYPDVQEKKPTIKENTKTEPVIEELRSKIRLYKNDIWQITKYNQKLLWKIKTLKAMLDSKNETTQNEIDKKLKTAMYFKEQNIRSLSNKLNQRDELIYNLKNSAEKLNIMLSDTKNNIILKKLPNLSYHVYELHNKVIAIQDRDVLLVDNPSIYTQRTIEILKDKVGIILYKTAVKKELLEKLPFIFISANELDILEDTFYATISKDTVEAELKKQNILSKVVENYRKERQIVS